jgi:biotin/methionine sulfoxide reductase
MADIEQAVARPHSSHWGAFSAWQQDGRLQVRPHPGDPDPSPLLQNIPDAVANSARIARPMVRRSWLERGPGPDRGRGREDFCEPTCRPRPRPNGCRCARALTPR